MGENDGRAGEKPPPEAPRGEAEAEGPRSASSSPDVMFVHSPTPDGEGLRVIRQRESAIEVGELRAAKEGKPLHGDLVRLKPRPEHKQLFDVDVVVAKREKPAQPKQLEPREARGKGPAQVSSPGYRANWDRIFGGRDPSGGAPN